MKMNTNMVTMTCEDIRKMQEKYIKTILISITENTIT